MTWIALALAGLGGLVWLGRKKGDWRPASAVLGAAALVLATVAGFRQQWLLCAALAIGAAAVLLIARKR